MPAVSEDELPEDWEEAASADAASPGRVITEADTAAVSRADDRGGTVVSGVADTADQAEAGATAAEYEEGKEGKTCPVSCKTCFLPSTTPC